MPRSLHTTSRIDKSTTRDSARPPTTGPRHALVMIAMYILRCADNSYYVGSARNLEARMQQHAAGEGSVYTSRRMPVELVYAQEFSTVAEAYAAEKRVQGWSRAKREALIRGEQHLLPGLSKKDFTRADLG